MFGYFKRTENKEQDPLADIRKQVADTIAQNARQDPKPIRYEAFTDYEILMTKAQFPRLRKCAQHILNSSGVKEALANCKENTERIAQDEASKLRIEVANSLGIDELLDPPIESDELDPPIESEDTKRTSLTESRWEEPFLEIQATDAVAIADVGAKTVLHGLRLAVQDCTQAARYSYEKTAA